MGAHTKGPWIVEAGTGRLWVGRAKACGGKVGNVVVSLDYGLGYRGGYYDQQNANARLIASAPDLLEALTALYASYEALADSGDAGNWRLEDTKEGQQTLAAIRKATGEAS